jgi:hypothetical protein
LPKVGFDQFDSGEELENRDITIWETPSIVQISERLVGIA